MVSFGNLAALLVQFSGVIKITFITLIACSVIIALTWYILKARRFKQYLALIWKRVKDKEGNETLVFCGTDQGAILYNKKLKKRNLNLKRNRVVLGEEENVNFDENRNLDVPSVPSEKGGEIIFVEKLGPKKFTIGTPMTWKGNVEVIVSDADCAEAIRAYDLNAKYFGGKSWWDKWGQIISFTLFAVMIIVLIAVVLQRIEVFTSEGIKIVLDQKLTQGAVVTSNVP